MGAIRLFLALAVLQSHVYAQFLRPAQLYVNNGLALGVNGGYAVAFFFVISGFLISFVLEQKYDEPGGAWAFYRARALRIYPLWWCLYLIVPFITMDGLAQFVSRRHIYDLITGFFLYGSDWLLSFKAYPNQYTEPMPHGLELGWTLATELTFYLIAPFVLRSRVWPLMIFAGSALIRMVLNIYYPPDASFGIWNNWCYYFFPAVAFFFMLGHLTRELHTRLPLPSAAAAWGCIALAVVICLIQDAHYNYDNVDFYAAILLFAVALPRVFEATKDGKACNFLGDLTYPLYLSHGALLVTLVKSSLAQRIVAHIAGPTPELRPYMIFAKALLVSVPIWVLGLLTAVAVHYAIEKPAARVMRGALARLDVARSCRRERRRDRSLGLSPRERQQR